MKKTLLLTLAIVATFSINAQKIWNFSNTPFGTAVPTYSTTTVADGLTIMASASATVVVDANSKKNLTASATNFTHRIKLGGSGSPDKSTAPYLPTTRALVFNVSGPGSINVCCLSSSGSVDRKLTITNGTDSLGFISAPGTYTDAAANTVGFETFNYTGGAGTLYIYSPSSGVNIYYIEVTSYSGVFSKLTNFLADKGVSLNGKEIVNSKKQALEIFNVLGKKVLSSSENVSLKDFQKGIYIVRVAGSNEALKFSI